MSWPHAYAVKCEACKTTKKLVMRHMRGCELARLLHKQEAAGTGLTGSSYYIAAETYCYHASMGAWQLPACEELWRT